MKKFMWMFGIWIGVLMVIGKFNDVLLLTINPLEYYYTIEGMLLTFAMMTAEAALIVPISIIVWKKLIWPSWLSIIR